MLEKIKKNKILVITLTSLLVFCTLTQSYIPGVYSKPENSEEVATVSEEITTQDALKERMNEIEDADTYMEVGKHVYEVLEEANKEVAESVKEEDSGDKSLKAESEEKVSQEEKVSKESESKDSDSVKSDSGEKENPDEGNKSLCGYPWSNLDDKEFSKWVCDGEHDNYLKRTIENEKDTTAKEALDARIYQIVDSEIYMAVSEYLYFLENTEKNEEKQENGGAEGSNRAVTADSTTKNSEKAGDVDGKAENDDKKIENEKSVSASDLDSDMEKANASVKPEAENNIGEGVPAENGGKDTKSVKSEKNDNDVKKADEATEAGKDREVENPENAAVENDGKDTESVKENSEEIVYPWDGMNDEEFAEWITGGENDEYIRKVIEENEADEEEDAAKKSDSDEGEDAVEGDTEKVSDTDSDTNDADYDKNKEENLTEADSFNNRIENMEDKTLWETVRDYVHDLIFGEYYKITLEDEETGVSVTGKLPGNTELEVIEMDEKQVADYIEEGQQLTFAYDITLIVDGEEYQPETPVDVKIPSDREEGAEIKVQHVEIDKKTGEAVATEVENKVDKDGNVKFEAESFSLYFGTEYVNRTFYINSDSQVGFDIYKNYTDASAIEAGSSNYSLGQTGYFVLEYLKENSYFYAVARKGYRITAIGLTQYNGSTTITNGKVASYSNDKVANRTWQITLQGKSSGLAVTNSVLATVTAIKIPVVTIPSSGKGFTTEVTTAISSDINNKKWRSEELYSDGNNIDYEVNNIGAQKTIDFRINLNNDEYYIPTSGVSIKNTDGTSGTTATMTNSSNNYTITIPKGMDKDQTVSITAKKYPRVTLNEGTGYKYYTNASCTNEISGSQLIDNSSESYYIYIKPDTNYYIKDVTINEDSVTKESQDDGTYKITIPTGFEKDVTISATAKKYPRVIFSGDNYSCEVDTSDGEVTQGKNTSEYYVNNASSDKTVYFRVTANEGYRITNVKVGTTVCTETDGKYAVIFPKESTADQTVTVEVKSLLKLTLSKGRYSYYLDAECKNEISTDTANYIDETTYCVDNSTEDKMIYVKPDSENTIYKIISADIKNTDGTTPTSAIIEDSNGDGTYEIKIPTDVNKDQTVNIYTAGIRQCSGEHFAEISKEESCDVNISEDYCYTVQMYFKDLNGASPKEPYLTFSEGLPAKTKIIMQMENIYWYYNMASNGNEVELNNFTKMGASGNYSFDIKDSYNSALQGYGFRFIVDFSDVETSWITENGMNLTTSLNFKDGTVENKTITASTEISIKKKSQYEIAVSGTGMEKTISVNYTKSDGKIDNSKKMALVLSAPEGFPSDARIISGENTYYLSKNRKIVIPLGEICSVENMKLKLETDCILIPNREYSFDGEIYVDEKENSPLKGKTQDDGELKFKKGPQAGLKLSEGTRLADVGGNITVNVVARNMTDGISLTGSVMKKSGSEEYKDTSLKLEISTGSNTIPLTGLQAGSYCLMVSAVKDSTELLKVPYYFIIKEK